MAATATLQPPPIILGNDALSLHSRRSLKAVSVRLRSVLSFSNFVGSVRRKETPAPARFEDITMGLGLPVDVPPNNTIPFNPAKPTKPATKPAENEPASTSAPVQRSKSRLVRMLTSKKAPRDDSEAPTRPSKRPVATGAFSKEQREAALRARGLLPPLSLSQQERELDSTIPVVKPMHTSNDEVSAADLIKQQWESKNKDVVERLDSFKFGASSPTDLSSSKPFEAKEPNPNDEPRSSKADEPIAKQTKAQRRQGLHQASLSQPMRIETDALRDHRRSNSLQHKALPNVPENEVAKTPLTPVLDLPTEFQSYLDTPPSPQQRTTQLSPDTATAPRTPKDERGPRSPHQAAKTSTRKQLPTPSNSLVSPSSAISPTDTLVNDAHTDSPPQTQSGSSSILTPSLDSASSTTKSNESLTNGKAPKPVVKPIDNAVPVILENPLEDDSHEALTVEHVLDEYHDAVSSSSDHDDNEFSPAPLVPPRDADRIRKRGVIDPPSPSPAVKLAAEKLNANAKREVAAPSAAPTRKKTINPFKRNQQTDDTPKRSLASLSRSVVGTVLRPRRDTETAIVPPSPTAPPQRAVSPPLSPSKRAHSRPPAPAVTRQAVNPVYYSGGDIQAQANDIKDEEERRMAELAFLY